MLISVFLTQNLYSFIHFDNLFGVRLNELAVVTHHHNSCLVVDIAYGVVHERLKIVVNEIVGFVENKEFGTRHQCSGKEHTLQLASTESLDGSMGKVGNADGVHDIIGPLALFLGISTEEPLGGVHARGNDICNRHGEVGVDIPCLRQIAHRERIHRLAVVPELNAA